LEKETYQNIRANYRRAKHFTEIFNDFTALIKKDYPNIASINITMIKFFAEKLGIKTRFINASELKHS